MMVGGLTRVGTEGLKRYYVRVAQPVGSETIERRSSWTESTNRKSNVNNEGIGHSIRPLTLNIFIYQAWILK